MHAADYQLVGLLKNIAKDFCAALTDDEIARFTRYTDVKEVVGDTVIADINEIGNQFYLVLKGTVNLYQVEADTEYQVGTISAGSLVGEMSFFDRLPRTVRLRAGLEGVTLLEVSRPNYSRLKIEEPYIATNILEFVVRSLDFLVRFLSDSNAQLNKKLKG